MYKCTVQRRFVTLIEMMIVMFLIALITGVVAANYRGGLDEGKAFKSKMDIEKLETVLNLEMSKHPNAGSEIQGRWQDFVRASPFVRDPNSLVKDGWGELYQVTIDPETGGVRVTSSKYDEYLRTNNSAIKK